MEAGDAKDRPEPLEVTFNGHKVIIDTENDALCFFFPELNLGEYDGGRINVYDNVLYLHHPSPETMKEVADRLPELAEKSTLPQFWDKLNTLIDEKTPPVEVPEGHPMKPIFDALKALVDRNKKP